MSPLDSQLIHRKAKFIEGDLSKLKEFQNVSIEEYINSLEIRLQVERLLQRIIGRVIDINYHLLKEKFHTLPNDYYTSFTQLAQHGILDKPFAGELAQSTGLRNVLAHEYDAIDDNQIHAAITTCLRQIPHYLHLILSQI